jgi:hypothetical protein
MDKAENTEAVSAMTYPPLTEWANEPLVEDLKADLLQAQTHHDVHVQDVNRWLDNMYLKGGAKHPKQDGRSGVTPKLIRKQAEWRYAALSEPFLSPEVIFKLEPRTWEDREAVKQSGLILNSQWNTKIDKVKFIDDYVRTAVDEGSVVVRTGWHFEEEEVIEPNYSERIPRSEAQMEAIIAAVQSVQSGEVSLDVLPDNLRMDVEATIRNGEVTDVYRNGERRVKRTVRNHPTAEVVDFNSVIIDPNCRGDLSKANFIIYRFDTSMSELEKTGLYDNLDMIDIEKHSIAHEGESYHNDHSSFRFQDEPRKRFTAYEYWGYWDIDGNGKTEAVVTTWVGDVMIRCEKSPYPDNELPFVLVHYLPKRNSVYGEPDGELLEENQKISGAITRGMLDTMGRAAVGQRGIMRQALDVTNRRRYERGEDYEFNQNVDPRMAFYTHTYPELPASAPFMLEMQNQEAESLTGVKAFTGGISGEGLGRSATAARTAMDAASKREIGILRRLANGLIQIGRKHMAMNALFLDEEEVVRVTNEEFVVVKRDDLASRADIKLDISTAETDNAKAQELSFMLQTMGPNLPFEITQQVMADITELRKMPETAHRLRNYQPQPDPHQERLKQLEIAEAEARIEKLRSEAAENYAEAQKDTADAQKATSEKEKLDLDYVEQATGTVHARELENMGEQARANIELERAKASNNPGSNPGSDQPEGVEPAF